MRMVADNQICSAVNRSMGQRLLRLIRLCCLLTSPVECCNDQFCALLLRILDIGTKLFFTVIGSIIYKNSDKCNFYTIDLFDGCLLYTSRLGISSSAVDRRFLFGKLRKKQLNHLRLSLCFYTGGHLLMKLLRLHI